MFDDDEEDVQLDVMHSDIRKMLMFCSINWLSHITTSLVTMKVIAECSFALY